MSTLNNDQVLRRIREKILSGLQEPLAYALSHIVIRLPIYREELAVLMAERLELAPLQPHTNCDDCLDDLPAFIDLEGDEGPKIAAQTYPHVWWHLWSCAECAEVYLATCDLQEAERKGQLLAGPVLPATIPAKPQKPRVRILTLASHILHYALPSPSQSLVLGAAHGYNDDENEIVLVEENTLDDKHLTLSVAEQQGGNWNVIIEVTPPATGNVVLTLGKDAFSAPFNNEGSAVISDIPSFLLTDPEGPGLVVEIESDEQPPYRLV